MATPTTLPGSFSAGNVLLASEMNALRGAFRILQVVSTTKTDTYTMASSTFTDVTGLTASITPSATSSKILILVQLNMVAQTGATNGYYRITRAGTAIDIGDAASNRVQATGYVLPSDQPYGTMAGVFLDSPSTTSATTYAIQVRRESSSGTIYVNRANTDTDSVSYGRTASTITVMEVSA